MIMIYLNICINNFMKFIMVISCLNNNFIRIIKPRLVTMSHKYNIPIFQYYSRRFSF